MNWKRFFRRDFADAEQQQELEFYLDLTAEEDVERGMEPSEARAAARKKLGNTTLIREEVYQMNTVTFVEDVVRNVRHSWPSRIRPHGCAPFGAGHRSEHRNLQRRQWCID